MFCIREVVKLHAYVCRHVEPYATCSFHLQTFLHQFTYMPYQEKEVLSYDWGGLGTRCDEETDGKEGARHGPESHCSHPSRLAMS